MCTKVVAPRVPASESVGRAKELKVAATVELIASDNSHGRTIAVFIGPSRGCLNAGSPTDLKALKCHGNTGHVQFHNCQSDKITSSVDEFNAGYAK